MMLLSDVEIMFDNATITNPLAAQSAISLRNISFLTQKAEALVSCVPKELLAASTLSM